MYDRLQEVALGVANAMSHLHSQPLQIAFRDLKPQNIGFDSRGVVKLFDLGMARPIQETKAVGVAGTYRYLSPEALLGKTITVASGATLSFTSNNIFGNGVANSDLPALVLNGGTLSSTRYNVLGDVALNGGILTQASTDSASYEGYQFRGTVTVGGSAASSITTGNAFGGQWSMDTCSR